MSSSGFNISISGDSNDSNLVLGSTSGVITENAVANLATLETKTATLETKTATLETKTATLETKTATLETKTATSETKTATLETDVSQNRANLALLQKNDVNVNLIPSYTMHKAGFNFDTTYLPVSISSVQNAYAIQNIIMPKIRLSNNETFGGFKAGLTSLSTQSSFGLNSAMFGQLSQEKILPSGTTQSLSEFVASPRYEGEISLRMKSVDLSALEQNYPFDASSVKPFIKNVMGSFEILDFRSYGGNVANAFAVGNIFYKNTIIGTEVSFNDTIMDEINSLVLEVSGTDISGLATAVQPSILSVVAQVLNHAAQYKIPLLEDNVIMTGSFIGINPITLNVPITLNFGDSLGSVTYTLTS